MKKYIIALGASFLPVIASAQTTVTLGNLQSVANAVSTILNIVFPVLLAVSVFVIIWGIFKFILNAGDEEARKTGRTFILWGIIGIFLMLSVWGLVRILTSTIGFASTAPISTPAFLGTGAAPSGPAPSAPTAPAFP